MIKFLDILGRYEASEFSQLEAAELLGVGERTFRRWRDRYEAEGELGLRDRRLGKASPKRVPVEREAEIEALYRERYAGFTAKHFHERLVGRHGFRWGYTWTKTFLHSRGLLERAKRRGAHRRKRPRRPLPGMMLHQDGSRHEWLAGQPALDLIVTLDDATSAILSAFLVAEEGTDSTFMGLRDVFARHGLPLSLYTDRGSHYFHTAEANGKVDRDRPTQVGRALAHLGVEHIAAYSPQARGRSERAFRTLQDRLPKELALAGVVTLEAANAFLGETYIPAHNARFARAPEQEGSAFIAVEGVDLGEILCVQEERCVGNDNCVRFNGLTLQIPESPLRPHFVKANVKVRRYPDATHAVFHGQRCLGRYDEKGALREDARSEDARSEDARSEDARSAPRSRQAMVVDGRALVKAGLRPPPPAAAALTKARPSTVRAAKQSKGKSGPPPHPHGPNRSKAQQPPI